MSKICLTQFSRITWKESASYNFHIVLKCNIDGDIIKLVKVLK